MCLRSTLSLWIAIAVLVQQSTFVCAQDCNCRCNNKSICPEIESLKTDISGNIAVLNSLKPNVEHSKDLWEKFNYEVWTEKVAAIENKMKSLEGLKERLDEAESRGNSLQRDLENATNALEASTEKVAAIENKMKSLEGLKESLDKAESRADRLETDLQNATKDFEKKIAEFEKKLENVQRQATTLDTNVKKAEKNITTTQKKVAEFEKTLESVQRQAKKLGENITKAEESITTTQEELLLNTSKRFSEIDKKYEDLKDDIDTKLLNVENYTKLLKSDIVQEIRARKISESQLMQNISEEFSEAEKYYNILKDDLKAEILKVEDQAKSDVEQEKESRISSEEQLLQTVSRKHSETESQFEKLKNHLQSQLLLIKNETIDLTFDIENQLRTELQEELLLNTSKRFSEIDKKYEDLKDDIITKLLNVENYTKLLKSRIVQEIRARKISESQLMQNISYEFSEAEKQYNILKDDLKAEILKVEDQAKSDVEQEKESRISSEKQLLQTVSRKHSETQSQFEKLKNHLQSQLLLIKNETMDLIFDIEKELRTELQVKLQGKFSTSAAAQQYSEIKKNLSSFEGQLRTLDQHLSTEKMSNNLVRKNYAEFGKTLENVKRQAQKLESNIKKAEENITTTQKQLLQTVSRKHSETQRQFEKLKNHLQSQLHLMKTETIDLKSDIEKELRTELQKKIAEFEKTLENVNRQAQTLGRNIKKAEESITTTQEKMRNISMRMSALEPAVRKVQNDVKEFYEKLLEIVNNLPARKGILKWVKDEWLG